MPIRVLFLAANPADTDQLRLDQEFRAIDERIEQGAKRESIDLVSNWAVQADDLANLLMRRRPHVVHFSGHGSPDGILFDDPTGAPVVASPDAVAELFRILKDEIRCVVLNACFSARQADAIAKHIEVVIGTSAGITDDDAIRFAAGFYRGISDGRHVRDAFDLGVVAAQLHGAHADHLPHLVSGGDPAKIVLTSDHAVESALDPDTSYSRLSSSSDDEIHSLLSHYKKMIANNPADPDAQYQLGLCYLQLRLYDLAIKAFEQTIDLDPAFADAYYYLGVSLIRGRRPKILKLNETERVEELLSAAATLKPKDAKFDYLAAIINYDYYAANGLTVPEPSYESLLAAADAKSYDSWEVERLLSSVPVVDEYLLSRVRG